MFNFVAHGGQIAWDELLMLALPLVLLLAAYRRLLARPDEPDGGREQAPDSLPPRRVRTRGAPRR